METKQVRILVGAGPIRHMMLGLRNGALAGIAIGLAMLTLMWIIAPFYFTTSYRTFILPAYLVAYPAVLFAAVGGAVGILIGVLGRFCAPLQRLDPCHLHRSLAAAFVPVWLVGQYVTWVVFRGRTGPAMIASSVSIIVGMLAAVVIVYRRRRKLTHGGRSKWKAGVGWSIGSVAAMLSFAIVWTRPPRADMPPADTTGPSPPPADSRPLTGSFDANTAETPSPPQRVTRIVLITFDTLRRDRLGCYGYDLPTSPNLDSFATEFTLFENMYAQAAGTVPSFCSIFSGMDPVYTGGLSQASKFSDDIDTVVERLQRFGYWTDATVCQSFLVPERGFSQGFESYTNIPVDDKGPDTVTDAAIGRLTAEKDRGRTFFWFHYFNTHTPYDPPPDLVEVFKRSTEAEPQLVRTYDYSTLHGIKSDTIQPRHHAFRPDGRVSLPYVNQVYDAEVRHLDDSVGRLLDHLRHMDGWDQTAVIITADHGEALGEHGVYCRHCVDLYDAYVRIPLIVKWPKNVAGRSVVRHSVLTSDITPTILAMAGLEPGPQMTGQLLLPLVSGGAATGPDRSIVMQTAFCEGLYFILNSRKYAYPDWAIIENGHKYIFRANSVFGEVRTPLNYINAWRELVCGHIRPDELYRLGEDEDEGDNIIAHQLELARTLRRRLLSSPQLQFFRSNSNVRAEKMDQREMDRLRSLGYL